MKLSIIIPNFNGEGILKKNLPHVLKSIEEYEGNAELIIVDDSSVDSSVGFIGEFISKNKDFEIKLFQNETNLGFSSTVNKGARNASGDIIILLNSDVEPRPDFLKYLVKNFENDNVFATGFLDESEENGKIVKRGRGVGSIKRGFLVHRRGEIGKRNTLWAAGGSSAFRKSLWEKLGGMDEIYNPFYWDDIDLSYRALKSGYKILFEDKSVVVHRHLEGSIKNNYTEAKVKRIAYRNQFIFVWKNFELPMLVSHIAWLPYHLGKALASLNWSFLAGFLMALIRIPKVLKSRSIAFRYFVKKDQEVVKEISK
ncbi:MAG: hypothetical protein A2186_00625 [Candidatus Levybacteria bacterium RIFOXYA1_FULL_41_10]|nr:MAG: Glycosyl transferase, family 2 [Candidatus Levybacteria bacterium GW2011_GWA2_36_13]KKQ00434.1 MAG: Glycosyl transferase, family 2 [Candidatus Levybacteria bacterium GW2011_GWB1_36_18]KKR16096.1 MAG: Glycosyl transferase, family 2 [Candidatus Levybacteria bacterium GW2011_GWA1_39_32]KKR51133.1 MAG: Glycosyl transferase, family 2 [Candidatus Levybacteria bacterium GW2011_GWC1_40_19]OGH20347.1 MAG: hypothetical protein A2695_02750 [Candidatus Levybacteria bacterium RIFCSPHIGHO2_01_FULL_40